jgi:DNA polymerase
MGSAADLIPPDADLDRLRAIAAGCTACDLHRCGTQTVFGQGRIGSPVMLVGEQPGDKEDVAGQPFVGPAGGVLDRALDEAGIRRGDAYVTNVVKHFKWQPTPRGKRRIHQKPNAAEVSACRPWLDAEIERVRPRVVVVLGATAAQALLGRTFKVTQQRGQFVEWDREPLALATVHPSSILRAPDDEARRQQFAGFVADLRVVAQTLDGAGAALGA